MNSIFLRARNLSVLMEHLLKSEVLGLQYGNALHKTLFTKSPLLSNSIQRKTSNINKTQEYIPSNKEQNLGTIVDLGVDFESVKIEDEKGERVKKKRIKTKGEKKTQLENDEENEVDESDAAETKTSNVRSYGKLLFSSIMTQLKSHKTREKKQEIILEGKRLIHDAITAGFIPKMIFYSRESDLEKLNVPDSVKVFYIPYKSFKLWTDVVTPQGIIGVFEMPDLSTVEIKSSLPLTIICDNVREPGNLGTIIRVAAAVGCKKLILTKGCVNIWESKVLRAAAGAHFHIPILRNRIWSDIESEVSADSKVFLADLNNETVDDAENAKNVKNISNFTVKNNQSGSLPLVCYSSVKYTNEDLVIIIGGETLGLCNEAYDFAAKRKGVRVFIPMDKGIESLNNSVALGILAYDLKRQLISAQGLDLSSSKNVDSEAEK